jgi:protein-S-isoprenylcysteine O-methyltransferase Ste14
MIQSRLAHECVEQGTWLFRWRSYIPLALLPFAVLAIWMQQRFQLWNRECEWVAQVVCLAVSLSGIVVRGLALGFAQRGTSGRNTQKQVADHLNTVGMYSVCRHPLYLGNILIATGVLLFTQSLFFVLFGVLAYWLFYEKITATEEQFIAQKFGDVYAEWAARTPYLIPAFRRWKSPGGSFSWRSAIRSELYSFCAVAVSFAFMDGISRFLRDGHPRPARGWLMLLAAALLLFFVGRYLRKYTRFFNPPEPAI